MLVSRFIADHTHRHRLQNASLAFTISKNPSPVPTGRAWLCMTQGGLKLGANKNCNTLKNSLPIFAKKWIFGIVYTSYGSLIKFLQSLTESLLKGSRFCVEISSTRTQQRATKDFFLALRNTAVPIVVVGTKKNVYWNTKFGESYTKYSSMEDLKVHVDTELEKRMWEIQQEVDSIKDGRYDAVISVSKGM